MIPNTPKRKYNASKRKLFPHVPKPVSLSGIDDADRMLLSRVGQGSMSEGVRTLCQWRREFEKASGGELPPSPLLSADAPDSDTPALLTLDAPPMSPFEP